MLKLPLSLIGRMVLKMNKSKSPKKERETKIKRKLTESAEIKKSADISNSESEKIVIINKDENKMEKNNSSEIKNTKISIVDLSPNTKKEKKNDRLMEKMVFIGGGIIAITSFTSKKLAEIGNNLLGK